MKSRSPAQRAFLAINKPKPMKFGQAWKKGLSLKAHAPPRMIEAHKMRGQKTFRPK